MDLTNGLLNLWTSLRQRALQIMIINFFLNHIWHLIYLILFHYLLHIHSFFLGSSLVRIWFQHFLLKWLTYRLFLFGRAQINLLTLRFGDAINIFDCFFKLLKRELIWLLQQINLLEIKFRLSIKLNKSLIIWAKLSFKDFSKLLEGHSSSEESFYIFCIYS